MLSPLWTDVRMSRLDAGDRRRLRAARPLERKLFGRKQRAVQPAVCFPGGSTLAWY
jgi:hypothetical protein